MSGGDQGTYAFGDTAMAAERLALVARVFEPATRAFLARVGPRTGLVLDVGCGPGHTTRLLADAFPDTTLIGLDQSTAFLAEARRGANSRPAACCRSKIRNRSIRPTRSFVRMSTSPAA